MLGNNQLDRSMSGSYSFDFIPGFTGEVRPVPYFIMNSPNIVHISSRHSLQSVCFCGHWCIDLTDS